MSAVVFANNDTFSYIGHLLSGVNTSDKGIAKETYKAFKLAALLVKESTDSDKFFDLHAALRHKLMVLQKIGVWKKQETEYELHKIKKQLLGIAHALEIIDNYISESQQGAGDPSARPLPQLLSKIPEKLQKPAPKPGVDEVAPVIGEVTPSEEENFELPVEKPQPQNNKLPIKMLRYLLIKRRENKQKPKPEEKEPTSPEISPITENIINPETINEQIPQIVNPTEELPQRPVQFPKVLKKVCKKMKQMSANTKPLGPNQPSWETNTQKPQVSPTGEEPKPNISIGKGPQKIIKIIKRGVVNSNEKNPAEIKQQDGNPKDALELLANYFG